MANKEIDELTAGTQLDGTELFHGVQGGNSRKFTAKQLLTPTLSASDQSAARTAISAALKGHMVGLVLSNNATDASNDIDIAAGEAASAQASPLLMVYAGATGRQLDVAYGTGSGARFDTSISDGLWFVFLISNGAAVAIGVSKSADPTGQANYPSGYTHYVAIGHVVRASSANLVPRMYGQAARTRPAESTQQTITFGGTITFPHGMGSSPKQYDAFLVCQTSQFGYSSGEEVKIPPGVQGDNTEVGISIRANSTNIVIVLGTSGIRLIDTSGVNQTIAAANWKIVARAWP